MIMIRSCTITDWHFPRMVNQLFYLKLVIFCNGELISISSLSLSEIKQESSIIDTIEFFKIPEQLLYPYTI